MISSAYFILYVTDQSASTEFYSTVLDRKPRLNVPGMTEFELVVGAVLGLMPVSGIERLIPPQAVSTNMGLKAELYLMVDDPAAYHRRALAAGAQELSPLGARDWGHEAAYSVDRDDNVIVFACQV